jgi:ABC-type bacteriocin/lantibiotic exporter with double-glycine peptidase domain
MSAVCLAGEGVAVVEISTDSLGVLLASSLSRVRRHWSFVVLTSALGLVQSAAFYAVLVDRVMILGHYNELPHLALGVVGVAIIQGACRYGRRYLGHIFGANSCLTCVMRYT